MIYKGFFKIFIAIIYFIGCSLLFNHVYSWLGIIMTILGIVFIINFFYNKIKS